MSKFMEDCFKTFKSQNLYEILGVKKGSSDEQVRKAYHELSLKIHPDRVDEENKANAEEQFKVLSKIYSVLSCKKNRTLYDITETVYDKEIECDVDYTSNWKSIIMVPQSHQDCTYKGDGGHKLAPKRKMNKTLKARKQLGRKCKESYPMNIRM